jgi:hypothetical protein
VVRWKRNVELQCGWEGNMGINGMAMDREAIELQSDHDLGAEDCADCRITRSDDFTTA